VVDVQQGGLSPKLKPCRFSKVTRRVTAFFHLVNDFQNTRDFADLLELWPNLGDGRRSRGDGFSSVGAYNAVDEFYTFDEPRQLICAVNFGPSLGRYPNEYEDHYFCTLLRRRALHAHSSMSDGGEYALD
jgi:hypothetical protein